MSYFEDLQRNAKEFGAMRGDHKSVLAAIIDHMTNYGESPGISVPRSAIESQKNTRIMSEWSATDDGVEILVLKLKKEDD